MRPVTVLSINDGEIAGLRFLAHMEAGDQVIYEGDLTDEPWWPAIEGRFWELMAQRDEGII